MWINYNYVSAQVISLGISSYQLSTAQNELGVVLAQSVAGKLLHFSIFILISINYIGYTMVPISWEEMMCPHTKVTRLFIQYLTMWKMIEYRKCAKPME